jgi:PDZ domain-containing protein
MRRRGVTVLLGLVFVLLLGLGVATAPVPYVVLGPGPTVNTLGTDNKKEVIEVTGRQAYQSAGQLRLVTVGVQNHTDLISAIRSWFNNQEAVVPRELIYPPGQTEQQVEQQNKQDFQESQTSAETTALRELGYPVSVTVTTVADNTPAAGVLKTGDVITFVDGTAVTSGLRLTQLVKAKKVGTELTIDYTRAGAKATAKIKTAAADDGTARIGISIENKQPHPFELKFDLDNIGGPSAGLMFSLGIVDKLGPEDLTGGKIIAGTGTIDDEGQVGAIGGIPQKLVGAKDAGAVAFLTPADNCQEAVANAQPGLPLYKVSTMADALAALQALRENRQPTRC